MQHPTTAFLLVVLAACGPQSASPPAALEGPSATISGRVLAPPDQPLGGVRVRLYSGGVPWNSRTPALEFEAATDALGFFRIEVPIPTPERFVLALDPDRFHLSHSKVLSADLLHPSLGADAGFAGEFALGPAGVVAGRVITRDGLPIVGASASAITTASTAQDGTFQLEHVPVDTTQTHIDLPGFGSQTIEHPPVLAGRVTYLPDVVLEPPAKIAGVVVDREGLPIESAQIEATPLSGGGRHAHASSDAQGRFVMELPHAGAHTLAVFHEDFLRRRALDETRAAIQPGREDVRIVLDRPRKVTFVVLDTVTGSRAECETIEIVEDAADGWTASVYPATRDGVPVEPRPVVVGLAPAIVTARTLDRDRVVHGDRELAQPIFLPFRGPLRLDAGSTDRMTIFLARAGSIGVQLSPREAISEGKVSARVVETDEWYAHSWRDRILTSEISVRGHDTLDASLMVRGLVPGTYDVTIESAAFVRRTIKGVRVGASEDVDLGRIELTRGGTVRGRVLLREGIRLEGLWLRVEGEPVRIETAIDGSFAFTNLPAGKHRVTLLESPPRVLARQSVQVELESGGAVDVVLDARD